MCVCVCVDGGVGGGVNEGGTESKRLCLRLLTVSVDICPLD